ncbi:hypothetical protein [Ornithinibacillus californiensis]|uniref:hypothetical protein n=1 Tax=Ornithinibacillus californiensis TaxID=161536 RepID=UPI0012EEC5BA|nr:hypothetical protein [Ornithinibacillus californiensis]
MKERDNRNLDKHIVRNSRDSDNNMWSHGRNAATGFTFKGLFMLIGLVVIVAIIRGIFF